MSANSAPKDYLRLRMAVGAPEKVTTRSLRRNLSDEDLALVSGLVRLNDMPAPAGFPSHRWLVAKAAALTFVRQWLWQAIRLGWTPLELFGLHAVAPAARHDAKGVAWILEGGGRVLAMTEGTAAIMAPTGSTLTFYRRQAIDGAVLPWELTDRPEITACGSRK
jgi:hypothetical protein